MSNRNLSDKQFESVGRKSVMDNDVVSKGDLGPMRVFSVTHHDGVLAPATSINGEHVDTGKLQTIDVYGRERVRRHFSW